MAKGRVVRELLERYLVPKQYRSGSADTVELQERAKQAGPTLSPEEQQALESGPVPEGQAEPPAGAAPEAGPPAAPPAEGAAESAPQPGVFEEALGGMDLFTDPMPGRPPDIPEPEGRDLVHRTPERNINLSRVRTADDIMALIDETARITGPEATQTHKQTSALAGKVDVVGDLLVGGKPSDAWNPQQLLAARRMMVREAEELHELATDLAEREGLTKGSVSAAEWASFAQAKTRYVALQKVIQGKTRIAAQTLNALAITAGPTAKKARLQEIDAVLSNQGGPEELLRQAEFLAGNDPLDPKTAGKFGQITDRLSKAGTVAYSVWINGLLSSPPTHLVNVLSNGLVKGYEGLVINPLGGLIGNVRAAGGSMMGKDVTDRMGLEESMARISGLISGTLDGVVTATSTALGPRGSARIGRGTKVEAREYVTNLGNPVADYLADMALQGPSRFLEGEDQFFKVLSYREELNVQALRTARQEGLKGNALTERVGELVNNPTEDMHLAALEVAERLTFTNRPESGTLFGALAEAGSAARRQFGPLGFIIPFIRTPANIANYAIKNLPGLNTLQIVKDLGKGGAKADEAMARLTVSWASIWAIYQAVEEGHLTGSGPPNGRLMAAYRDSGWHPNAIRVGDKWFMYDRLDPVGLMIQTVANSYESVKHSKNPEDVGRVTMAALIGLANDLTDSTYLRGVKDLLGLLKNEESTTTAAVKWLGNLGSSFVPYSAALGYAARSGDLNEEGQARVRDAYKVSITGESPLWTTYVNQLANRSPWGRDDLPLKVDWKGAYVERDYGGYFEEAFPIKYAEVEKDPVAAALWENRVPVNPPMPQLRWDFPLGRTYEGEQGSRQPTHINLLNLDDGRGEVYEQYQMHVGQARYAALTRAVSGYDALDDTEKGAYSRTAERLGEAKREGTSKGKRSFMRWYSKVAKERGWPVPGSPEWAELAQAERPVATSEANPDAPSTPATLPELRF